VRAVEADYERHAQAALRVAREYYAAERVLADMVRIVGVG
jgi:hypothetical protein